MSLTETEKIILENTDEKYKYIARCLNGDLYLYSIKPYKTSAIWYCDGDGERESEPLRAFNHLFQNIKWETKEPYKFR